MKTIVTAFLLGAVVCMSLCVTETAFAKNGTLELSEQNAAYLRVAPRVYVGPRVYVPPVRRPVIVTPEPEVVVPPVAVEPAPAVVEPGVVVPRRVVPPEVRAWDHYRRVERRRYREAMQ